MAKHTIHSDSTGKYVVVVRGDTLSGIASECKSESGGKTYKQLAALNNIPNANLIYPNQKIYLTKSSSGGSSSTTSTNSNKATINQFGVQSTNDSTLFATWDWSKGNTENYEVWWDYDTGDMAGQNFGSFDDDLAFSAGTFSSAGGIGMKSGSNLCLKYRSAAFSLYRNVVRLKCYGMQIHVYTSDDDRKGPMLPSAPLL